MKTYRSVFCILLVIGLFLVCSVPSMGSTETLDIKITVNDVPIVMVKDDKVIKTITENGQIYVPLTPFLDALDIPYAESENKVSISLPSKQEQKIQSAEPTVAPTPNPYDALTKTDKAFLDMFLKHITKFKDPSSVSIVEVRQGAQLYKDGYLVTANAKNGFGGNTQNTFYFDRQTIKSIGGMPSAQYISQENTYNTSKLNKALKYEIEQMGY